MGRFTGFRCDRVGCKTVADGSGKDGNDTPYGWITVSVKTQNDVQAGTLMLCSSRCVRDWAVERFRAERGDAPRDKGVRSPEARHNMKMAQLRNFHEQGRHDDDPREDCPLCDEATA